MPLTHRIGPLTVIAVEDAAGPFFEHRSAAFPTATPRQWAEADAFDPDALTAEGEWLLRFRSYCVRVGDGPAILVDAGIGPAGSLAADWAPVPGRLPEALAEAGVAPTDVSAIVLTHLHNDHMGWAVPRDSPFTDARVVVQQSDVDAYAASREWAGQYDLLIEPLRAAGRLEVLDGDRVLAPGVRVVPTPGHTPGHQSVLISSGTEKAVILGDASHTPVQILHPEWSPRYDTDGEMSARTRASLFERIEQEGLTVAAGHYPAPGFGGIVMVEGKRRWKALS